MELFGKKKKRGRYRNISADITIAFTCFFILSVLVITIRIAKESIEYNFGGRVKTAYEDASTIAESIDIEMLKYYKDNFYKLEHTDITMDPNYQHYYREYKFIKSLRQNENVISSYVVFTEEEDYVTANVMNYIWDSEYCKVYSFEVQENEEWCYMIDLSEYDIDAEIMVSFYENESGIMDIIMTASKPIFDKNGNLLAYACIDMSWSDVIIAIFRNIVASVFSVILIDIIVYIAFYYFIWKRVIEPIRVMAASSKEMVSKLGSDEGISINIHSNDEMDDLARNYESMFDRIHEYIGKINKITAERERINAELGVAIQIQEGMLPKNFDAFYYCKKEVFAMSKPAKEVGGDLYDFFRIDDRHIALVMADVSGKGVPAALFMVNTKTLIKTIACKGGTPSEILSDVNKILCENNEAEFFVTAWLMIVDIETGKAMAANAGHEYPAYKKHGEQFKLIKKKHSLALGAMVETEFYNYEYNFEAGDEIFVYTDGVTEATNSNEELFGENRLLDSLNRKKYVNIQELFDNINEDIMRFTDGAEQFDDLTMLCFRY